VQINPFLTSTLGGGEWSALRPGYPSARGRIPTEQGAAEIHSRYGCLKEEKDFLTLLVRNLLITLAELSRLLALHVPYDKASFAATPPNVV
jgi:hypothetical protein